MIHRPWRSSSRPRDRAKVHERLESVLLVIGNNERFALVSSDSPEAGKLVCPEEGLIGVCATVPAVTVRSMMKFDGFMSLIAPHPIRNLWASGIQRPARKFTRCLKRYHTRSTFSQTVVDGVGEHCSTAPHFMGQSYLPKFDQASFDADKIIRADCFTTLTQDVPYQFSRWRELIAPLADVYRDGAVADGFRASGRAYDLGLLHLVSSSRDPMRYQHTNHHVRASGIDHWHLMLLKQGHEISRAGDRVLHSSAGDLHLKSLARPFEGCSGASHSVCLYLNRDNFPELTSILDFADHTRVTGIFAEMLKDCILALEKHVRSLTPAELPLVVATFTQLMTAAFQPGKVDMGMASASISAGRFNLARTHIQRNLASPDLGVNSICRAIGVSRRQLYYLFERQGGVANFIRERRLAACCKAIADPTDCRRISTIAYSYGFTSTSSFSRQFRAQYGFSPTQARAAQFWGHIPQSKTPGTFAEWLRGP